MTARSPTSYGMIHPNALETMTVRSVFVIDPNKKLRLTLTYPAATGATSTSCCAPSTACSSPDKHKVATPANWKQGGDVIILPSLSNDQAKGLFPAADEHKPYLRTTRQPGT